MILILANLKERPQKVLKLKEFSEVVRYKINEVKGI